jgi:hypothetical protein
MAAIGTCARMASVGSSAAGLTWSAQCQLGNSCEEHASRAMRGSYGDRESHNAREARLCGPQWHLGVWQWCSVQAELHPLARQTQWLSLQHPTSAAADSLHGEWEAEGGGDADLCAGADQGLTFDQEGKPR